MIDVIIAHPWWTAYLVGALLATVLRIWITTRWPPKHWLDELIGTPIFVVLWPLPLGGALYVWWKTRHHWR